MPELSLDFSPIQNLASQSISMGNAAQGEIDRKAQLNLEKMRLVNEDMNRKAQLAIDDRRTKIEEAQATQQLETNKQKLEQYTLETQALKQKAEMDNMPVNFMTGKMAKMIKEQPEQFNDIIGYGVRFKLDPKTMTMPRAWFNHMSSTIQTNPDEAHEWYGIYAKHDQRGLQDALSKLEQLKDDAKEPAKAADPKFRDKLAAAEKDAQEWKDEYDQSMMHYTKGVTYANAVKKMKDFDAFMLGRPEDVKDLPPGTVPMMRAGYWNLLTTGDGSLFNNVIKHSAARQIAANKEESQITRKEMGLGQEGMKQEGENQRQKMKDITEIKKARILAAARTPEEKLAIEQAFSSDPDEAAMGEKKLVKLRNQKIAVKEAVPGKAEDEKNGRSLFSGQGGTNRPAGGQQGVPPGSRPIAQNKEKGLTRWRTPDGRTIDVPGLVNNGK